MASSSWSCIHTLGSGWLTFCHSIDCSCDCLNLQRLLRVKTSQRGSVSCGRGWQYGSVSCGRGWCENCVKERNGKRRPSLFLQRRAKDCGLLSVEASGFLLARGIDHPKCWIFGFGQSKSRKCLYSLEYLCWEEASWKCKFLCARWFLLRRWPSC